MKKTLYALVLLAVSVFASVAEAGSFCYMESAGTNGGFWCILDYGGADSYNSYYGISEVEDFAMPGDVVYGAHYGGGDLYCTDNQRANAGCY